MLSDGSHPFEQLNGTKHGDNCSVNIRNGNPPSFTALLQQLQSYRDPLGSSVQAEAGHLLNAMLSHSAAQRPLAADVVGHPFFMSPAQKMGLLGSVERECEINRVRRRAFNATCTFAPRQGAHQGNAQDWRPQCQDLWDAFGCGGVMAALRDEEPVTRTSRTTCCASSATSGST